MGLCQKPLNLLLLLCICFSFHRHDFVSGNVLDQLALLDFKRSVSDPSGVLVSWNESNSDLCSWVGVSCGSNHRVVGLNITGRGNSGCFTGSKHDQFQLYGFEIKKNCVCRNAKLRGKLPYAISKLSELRILSLPFNDLEGEIRDEIWGLKNLEVIDLEGNMISGNLKSNFSHLKSLRILNLGFNQISGEIPDSLSNLKNLKHLSLSTNNLTGPIPTSLGKLKSLIILELSSNSLSGEIPEDLFNLRNLTVLLLDNNKLSGHIPYGFMYTMRMVRFNVSFNELSGPLPKRLMAVTSSGQQTEPSRIIRGNFVNSSDSSTPARKRMNRSLNSMEIALIALASVILLVLLGLIVLFFYFRRWPKPVAHLSTEKEIVLLIDIGVCLNFDSVIQATGNFNARNCIGNGLLGATYKGEISPGILLAIKRLTVGRFQGVQQFDAEIKTLGRLRHPNLVKLIGYHASETEMFLIFNYLPGGNLERFIQERSMRVIDWHILHKIALDVAQALAYLHDQCIPRVLHRKVKPSNILLDDDFNAYLSDFGFALILGSSETHTTTEVVGTFGYVAPEYAMTCQVSDKADVYSYGVVLLELLSDKRALDPTFLSYGNGFNIVEWALKLLREGRVKEFFTTGLWDVGPHDDLVEVFHLAIVCTVDAPSTRPNMKQVVQRLKELQPSSD